MSRPLRGTPSRVRKTRTFSRCRRGSPYRAATGAPAGACARAPASRGTPVRLWPSARLSMSCIWPGSNWKRADMPGSFRMASKASNAAAPSVIERHAGELLAVLHLEVRQPRDQPAVLVLEHRMVGRHDVVRRMLALAVEVERLIEPRQQLGMALAHLLVRRGEAHDAAHAAFHRRAQAHQADIVRRHVVVAVVGMEVLLGVGDVGPHAVAGRPAEIA